MNKKGQTDLRDLPSWKYMGWGILNGMFLGISIKQNVDVSETGIYAQIVNAFKPLYESAHISTFWLTTFVILLGIFGIVSTIYEIIKIYKKGWIPRIIALCGFASIFLIILNVFITFAVILFIAGAILVGAFPNE